MHEILMHPITKAAIAGVVAAAGVDIAAFRSWKTWHDIATYDWAIASFRWVQGAALGALTGLGYGALIG